jgi:hypothetical protein
MKNRNPKFQISNSKQIQNSKLKSFKRCFGFGTLGFGYCFGFRPPNHMADLGLEFFVSEIRGKFGVQL